MAFLNRPATASTKSPFCPRSFERSTPSKAATRFSPSSRRTGKTCWTRPSFPEWTGWFASSCPTPEKGRRYSRDTPSNSVRSRLTREVEKLAGLAEGFSGRDILGVCKNAERRYAFQAIRRETQHEYPTAELYSIFISQHLSNLKE